MLGRWQFVYKSCSTNVRVCDAQEKIEILDAKNKKQALKEIRKRWAKMIEDEKELRKKNPSDETYLIGPPLARFEIEVVLKK